MSSEAKITANRRNALKSTGPRTERGKSKSKLNAVTLGIYATTPVLHGEDRSAYREMEQENLEFFVPVGPVENILVHQITAEQWRLGRFHQAEVALGRQVQRAKVARLFEHLDKNATSYAHSLLNPNVDVGDYEPSPVATNYLASLAALRGLLFAKHNVVELTSADKKFINAKICNVLDVGSTVLESLTQAGESAPQDRLDRQRRTTVRALLSYVAELKKLQDARLTVTLTPAPPAEIDAAPMLGARGLKLVPASKPADHNDQGPENKEIEERAIGGRGPRAATET